MSNSAGVRLSGKLGFAICGSKAQKKAGPRESAARLGFVNVWLYVVSTERRRSKGVGAGNAPDSGGTPNEPVDPVFTFGPPIEYGPTFAFPKSAWSTTI